MTTNYDEHNYKLYSCPICGERYRAREDSNEYLNRFCGECESKKHDSRYPIRAEYNWNKLKWPDTVDRIDKYIQAGTPITFDQDENSSTAISPANITPKAEAMTWACVCGNIIPVTQDGKVMLHNIHGELLNVEPTEICRGSNKILYLNTAMPEHTHASIGTDMHEYLEGQIDYGRVEKGKELLQSSNEPHPLLSGTGKLPSKKKSNKKIKAYIADAVRALETIPPNDGTITMPRRDHNGNPIRIKHRYTPYGDVEEEIKIAPDKDGVISIW